MCQAKLDLLQSQQYAEAKCERVSIFGEKYSWPNISLGGPRVAKSFGTAS